MKAATEIRQLGDTHAIETPHTAYVARLALDLFDGFFPLPDIRREDRVLLFAAASLHDIGYADDPESHVEQGVSLLLETPLSAFSAKDWKSIAAIVLLHQRDWRASLGHELFTELSHKRLRRIKVLAAMLRIADGLDHGHIQDARILYCKHRKRVDKVGVAWGWYANNIRWAEEKADLWEAVFKRPFKIEARAESAKGLFGGVADKDDSVLSAARKILYSQYNVMRDNVPGMLDNGDPECLHDYRVAIRRFRIALRMFRPVLSGTGYRALEKALGSLLTQLSPIRDAHVQLDLFRRLSIPMERTEKLRQSLDAEVALRNVELAQIIGSSECRAMAQALGRFLRIALPEAERAGAADSYPQLAKKRFRKLMRQIADADISAIESDPEKLHVIRKLCRRGRYYAEYAAPALGRRVRKIAAQLKSAATALGNIRDAQLHAEILRNWGFEDLDMIDMRCENEWRRFYTTWKILTQQDRELK